MCLEQGEGAIRKVVSTAGSSGGPQADEDSGGKARPLSMGGRTPRGSLLSREAEQVLKVPRHANQRSPYAELGRGCKQSLEWALGCRQLSFCKKVAMSHENRWILPR